MGGKGRPPAPALFWSAIVGFGNANLFLIEKKATGCINFKHISYPDEQGCGESSCQPVTVPLSHYWLLLHSITEQGQHDLAIQLSELWVSARGLCAAKADGLLFALASKYWSAKLHQVSRILPEVDYDWGTNICWPTRTISSKGFVLCMYAPTSSSGMSRTR